MKKKFAKLSKREQETVEAAYHRMNPADLDEAISAATRQSPNAIRLPSRLVVKLKIVAKLGGEAEYQTMVKTWIKQRLQQEAKLAR